uniref:Uncharacterized protein n=1 Tax=Tanacetum cinerariifolium TaxID=118510 RepID=A0A6L2J9E8_TANCI|nr:hypothetical protein [Tanacetum cinerariifolium]
MMGKDDMRIELLHDLEKEAEKGAREKEDWPRMMVLYCQKSAEDDGIDVARKTVEFLNEYLWKDDKWMRKLRNMEMDANLLTFEKDHFIEKF